MSFHADEYEITEDMISVVNEVKPGTEIVKAYGICDCTLYMPLNFTIRCKPIIAQLSDGSELELFKSTLHQEQIVELFTEELFTNGDYDNLCKYLWSDANNSHPQGWTGEAYREAFGDTPPTGEQFYNAVKLVFSDARKYKILD